MVTCPSCGFDPTGLGPADAIAALRSFPRRFAELIEPRDRSEEDVAAARAAVFPAAEGAALVITELGAELRRVLVQDDPPITSTGDPGSPVPGTGEEALDHLREATTTVAQLASSVHGKDWERHGTRGGAPISALHLLTDAVHAGAHHLRAATLATGG